MGCGCSGGGQPTVVIKYEFSGQIFTTRQEAEAARSAAGGSGAVRAVTVKA